MHRCVLETSLVVAILDRIVGRHDHEPGATHLDMQESKG